MLVRLQDPYFGLKGGGSAPLLRKNGASLQKGHVSLIHSVLYSYNGGLNSGFRAV